MPWAVPMADAAQTGGAGVEEAKEAVTELTEGVTEDIGVGERPVHRHETKARKPKMATIGVRQTWNDCVGEEAARPGQAGPFCFVFLCRFACQIRESAGLPVRCQLLLLRDDFAMCFAPHAVRRTVTAFSVPVCSY